MANKFHDEAPLGEVHRAHNWEYSSPAARLAAGGFVVGDIYKLALQTDDMSLWMLLSTAPSWIRVSSAVFNNRGSYNASTNLFPATGGSGVAGAIMAYDVWYISVAGTLGGTPVVAGDAVYALLDSPAQTASKWRIKGNNVEIITDATLIRDSDNGIVGKTSGKINFKNIARTFTSFFTNTNTAARTYTFPNKDITVAGIDDTVTAAIAKGVPYLGASSGAVNAYVVAGSSIPNPPLVGQMIVFRATLTNTTITPTIDLGNGHGVKNIRIVDDALMWYGDISKGKMCILIWNSISWELINFEPVKVGSILTTVFGGATPSGYLWCSNVPVYVLRADYPALFAVIGTAFGSTLGTNFSLPWIPAGYAISQSAGIGTPGTPYAGSVIAHTHGVPTTANGSAGAGSRQFVDGAGGVIQQTQSTGGGANLPASTFASFFVKY